MHDAGTWIVGIFAALIGLIGLIFAANATDQGISIFGFALFAFAVLFIFSLIRRTFDMREAAAKVQSGSAEH